MSSLKLNTKNYAHNKNPLELPRLIDIQTDSFAQFIEEGLSELFHEVSPITSFNGDMKLYFPCQHPEAAGFDLTFHFGEPKYSVDECVERDMSYTAPLNIRTLLYTDDIDRPIVQDIFFGDFPLMTPAGTFIINGTERVVVSQLIRSPGVYFEIDKEPSTGADLAMAKLIPDRGAWMEFETRKTEYITVKFNRKRTVPITLFLRALAAVDDGLGNALLKEGTDAEILALFEDIDNEAIPFIANSIEQEPVWDPDRSLSEQALIEFYKRMRPGDPPTLENASDYLHEQLYDYRRYDLARVGRYKLSKRLNLEGIVPLTHRTINQHDIVRLVREMILINNGHQGPDDIDHLGNRRIKTVGELLQAKLRVGLRRMERVVRERMSIRDSDNVTPISLINIRPVVASIREFFGSSQLSQFMEQANPLAELTHKRTVSALGPGGLRRERAGFEVRDVHHSHYGRICPIETPEGPNIGLIGRLAGYARVNKYGFVETPYRTVVDTLSSSAENLLGLRIRANVVDPNTGEILAEKGTTLTEAAVAAIVDAQVEEIKIVPLVTDDIIYMSADEEDEYNIAQGNALVDEKNQFVEARVPVRHDQKFKYSSVKDVHYIDVAPRQIVGVSAALIPFLEHDDASRALMGSNMQRQAVPLLIPDVPIVSTGMEEQAAKNSGMVVISKHNGEVLSVTGAQILVQDSETGEDIVHKLRKYDRSNQSTCMDQHPIVRKGQMVKIGQVLADSSSTQYGELALGQDIIVAYLSWEGGNYEDAILVSENLVRNDKYTSIHIEKHELEARDTKLGSEEITYDIPNVSEEALKDLDENGIIRVGADVKANDILVGKITPKGEKELTPEEKLLRAIFGDKAREVKDSSLRLPHGARGKVVDVQIFDRQQDRDLPAGVEKMVRVSVAQRRRLTTGDKMAGRHGNKGVISHVVPINDMPYLADGRPVDIILSPIGVPGRMNLGQILETHLGWAAHHLGFRAITPVFDGAKEAEIRAELARSWITRHAWVVVADWAWEALTEAEYDMESLKDENEARLIYVTQWLQSLDHSYDVDRIANDEFYAKRVVGSEWLRSQGWDPEQIFPTEMDDLDAVHKEAWHPLDDVAIEACTREWYDWMIRRYGHVIAQEYHLDARNTPLEELIEASGQITFETSVPLPTLGKEQLFDGMTGTCYAQPVTVGITHMLKLAHLVEDKAHARSTGPYSLVTQQPLGGKAQFGGQRFGEMEVWALEAYGAAHILQEMLTVKSDDVVGRVKTYESIVKNEPIEDPGIPASFRVLVKELQSLGLSVEAITEGGDTIRFGKEDDKKTKPSTGTGLMDLANQRRAEAESSAEAFKKKNK